MEYSQPDFYHFSEDSTSLAECISKLGCVSEYESFLDVFSGSGVIGIELLLRLKSAKKLTFCELQREYEPHLKKNLSYLSSDQKDKIDINWMSYQSFLQDKKFDLIMGNPPYFKKGAGRKSPDKRKQICRFFEFGTIEDFLIQALKSLTDRGKLILVLREIPNIVKEKRIFREENGFLIVEVISLNIN